MTRRLRPRPARQKGGVEAPKPGGHQGRITRTYCLLGRLKDPQIGPPRFRTRWGRREPSPPDRALKMAFR
eukprot:6220961-Pyramimonas_sp.AAC.2